jgi:hypothetical protein
MALTTPDELKGGLPLRNPARFILDAAARVYGSKA